MFEFSFLNGLAPGRPALIIKTFSAGSLPAQMHMDEGSRGAPFPAAHWVSSALTSEGYRLGLRFGDEDPRHQPPPLMEGGQARPGARRSFWERILSHLMEVRGRGFLG